MTQAEQPNADRIARYFAPPLKLHEPDGNDAAFIRDAKGNTVAMLMWPTHPVEETEQAEQATYALGRLMASALTPDPVTLKEAEGMVDEVIFLAQTEIINQAQPDIAQHSEALASARGALIAKITPFLTRSAEEADAAMGVAASLAAAISLLERGGKKAAPSDKMFAQMLVDYRKSLDTFRQVDARAQQPAAAPEDSETEFSRLVHALSSELYATDPFYEELNGKFLSWDEACACGADLEYKVKARTFLDSARRLASRSTPPQIGAVERQRVPEELRRLNERALGDDLRDAGLQDAKWKFADACVRWVRSLISASPAVADGGWQGIASAPKDGTHVLVGTFPERPGFCSVTTAHWFDSRDYGAKSGEAGWALSVNYDGEHSDHGVNNPTHWQHRPAPPQQQPATPGQDGEGR
jgi:hypothetical protein